MKRSELFTEVSTAVLAAGAALADAAFSIMGMALLLQGSNIPYPGVFAASSGVFAIAMEGEIFSQNIRNAFVYSLAVDGLKHKIIQNLLIEKYNADVKTTNEFLKRYSLYYRAWQALSKAHHRTKEQAIEMDEYARTLFLMEEAALCFIQSKDLVIEKILLPEFIEDFRKLLNDEDKKNFKKIYAKKNVMVGVSKLALIGSMLGSYLCTQTAAKAMLIFFGIASGSTGVGIAAVIAMMAAVAYGFIIYRTFMQIIYDDLFTKYWHILKKSFQEGTFLKRMKIILTVLAFTVLVVGLTFATAGTWWKTGLAGQMMLINVANAFSQVVVGFVLSLYILTTMIFNIKNIAETVDQLSKVSFSSITHKISTAFHRNFIRPWRDLTNPYELCLMSTLPRSGPQKNKLYINIQGDTLTYTVMNLAGETITGIINQTELPHKLNKFKTLNQMQELLPTILKITAENTHTKQCLLEQAALPIKPFVFLACSIAYLLRATTFTLFFLWGKAIFAGHCISEGVTVDDSFLISTKEATVFKTLTEAAVDNHYFMDDHDDHPHKSHVHSHGHGHSHGNGHSCSHVQKDQEPLQSYSVNSHHHSNLPQKIFCVALSPLLVLNCILHKFLANTTWTEAKEKTMTSFWKSHDHAHDCKPKYTKPVENEIWKAQEQVMRQWLFKPTPQKCKKTASPTFNTELALTMP